MEYTQSYLPLWIVLISLIGSVLILISSGRPNLREFITILSSVIKFSLVASLIPDFLRGKSLQCDLFSIASGVNLSFRVDGLGLFFAIVASGLWILTSFYSIGYMRGLSEHKQTRYFASFAVALSSTMGIAFAGNLVTFIIFYEMLTISTYPLVIHKETPEAISAGRKYLAYTLSAGVILIIAISWIYIVTGSVNFQPGGILNNANFSKSQLTILFFLLIVGTGVKAALIPLHSWLPTAMIAPTPVSALLHAVAVVKAGVFGILRVVGYVMGFNLLQSSGLWIILAVLSAFTILVASLIAFTQDNLKRRLAYSTIAHLSYIILGASLINPTAYLGGILHLAAHATLKITLFFVAGAIYVKTHIENISELDGIGRKMPITMGAFALGSLGLAGIPPLNGFVSKFVLINGTAQSNNQIFIIIFLISGLLNAGYFFPIVYKSFFVSSKRYENFSEASGFMIIPIVITALLSLIFGIFPDVLIHIYSVASYTANELVNHALDIPLILGKAL